MTLSIQTCCPYCYSAFDMPQEQLDQSDAKGRCGQCQQVFLVNDHLVVTGDKQYPVAHDESVKADPIEQVSITTKASSGSYNFKSVSYKISPYDLVESEGEGANDLLDESKDSGSATEALTESQLNLCQIDSEPLDLANAWESPLNSATNTDLKARQSALKRSPATVAHTASKVVSINPESSSTIKEGSAAVNRKDLIKTNPTNLETIKTASKDQATNANEALADNMATIENSEIKQNITTADSRADANSSVSLHKQSRDERIQTKASATPLTHLLTNTSSNHLQHLNDEHAHTVQARIQPVAVRSQASAATIIWLAGCLVLLLLLFAQYIIFNLNILIKTPAYAERLRTLCSIVVCSLPSADLSAFSVTQPSFRRSKVNTAAGFSDVQADLVNNSKQAQLLPNLRVSIYDRDGLIGAFIATPDDYLLSTQNQLAGERSNSVMFTVPVAKQKISQVTIEAIY